jgi:hypothetical protein
VLFALVLFFAAASTRLGSPRAQWILLGVAIIFLIIATGFSPPSRSISDLHGHANLVW